MDIISSRESRSGGSGSVDVVDIDHSNSSTITASSTTNRFWTEEIPTQHLNNISDDIIIRAAALKDVDKDDSMNNNSRNDKKSSLANVPNNPEKSEGPPEMKQKIWPQVLASFAANMGAFNFGTVMAWSATGLASLNESLELGEISLHEESWIGSVALLGAVAACPFAGFGLVNFGRRKSMLYLTPLFILGWMLIAFANNLWMIYLGRFITGFCGGCFSVSAPIFTAETSDANIRGGLGSFFDLLLSLGMLYIYVIGHYATWRFQAIACGLMPIAFHAIMYFIPESPRYLVEKEKTEKATKAIRWLKGARKYPEFVQWELSELSKSVEQGKDMHFTLRDTFRRPIVKPTLILIGIMFFTTMSGVDAVVAYTVDIFMSSGAELDPKMCTIIIGLTQVMSTIPAALIVDHAGRRMLLMVSEIFMCFSLIFMGAFFYIKRLDLVVLGYDHDNLSWVPLASLIAFVIAYSFGFGPLSMMMIGEVLPNHMKGLTSCIVLMSRWLLAFAVTNAFETLIEVLHNDGTYWLFSAICGVGIFYVYFCIPETSGKSLDEIQIYFVKTKKLDKKNNFNNTVASIPTEKKPSVLKSHFQNQNVVPLSITVHV